VIVRRLLVALGVGILLVLGYLTVSSATLIHRSGGCNHIPLTAGGQPAYACNNQPPQ
jgi:hypothetical protein